MGQIVWILRESFTAYERFHGVFESKEAAKAACAPGLWAPIVRDFPTHMWDPKDPFDSKEGAESVTQFKGSYNSLWVVEPQLVGTL